jgi:pimeloyl-ACP methyl ester carboxylesterase
MKVAQSRPLLHTEYIQTHDGQYLCVDRIGSGKKVAILLHGIGGSSHLWMPFAMQNRGDYTFIIPNLRGFGKSRHVKFDHPNDVIRDYAKDLDTLVADYRGQGKVTIAGLSMGAYAAMHYFHSFGTERVEKFLSIDQSPKAMNGAGWKHGLCGNNQEAMFALFNKSRQDFSSSVGIPFAGIKQEVKDDYLMAVGKFIEAALHRPFEKRVLNKFRQLPGASRVMASVLSADSWESYYHCLESYQGQDYDFRGVMCSLDIPVTLFIGKHSEMYPADGQRYIQKHGHHVTAHEFAESHALMYTSPIQFTRHFNRFLQ